MEQEVVWDYLTISHTMYGDMISQTTPLCMECSTIKYSKHNSALGVCYTISKQNSIMCWMFDSGVLDDQVDLSYACDAPEVVVHTTKRSMPEVCTSHCDSKIWLSYACSMGQWRAWSLNKWLRAKIAQNFFFSFYLLPTIGWRIKPSGGPCL